MNREQAMNPQHHRLCSGTSMICSDPQHVWPPLRLDQNSFAKGHPKGGYLVRLQFVLKTLRIQTFAGSTNYPMLLE